MYTYRNYPINSEYAAKTRKWYDCSTLSLTHEQQ